ncbi:uncharacterized protein LOC118179827 [Stegodyphus dumicola]|uniref:uncharacterized protein LOC118179827 n=1 Tax=Stegodyphus dumicola TaxID=202533 RepID=UPI0015B30924|nr:uncharacterized protein LOC118179827 [Stegodyphus dumicola]
MERYGDVMTEFKSCESENYSHSRTFGKKGNSKMCKDDMSKPLFCSVSDCVTEEVIMEVRPDVPKKCIEFDCNSQSAENGYTSNAENFLSAIKSKAEEVINDCILPWEKSNNFSPNKKDTAQKLITHDTFVNGSKILKSNVAGVESDSINSKFSDISQNISSDSLVPDYEADISSSSVEILAPLTSTPVANKRNFVNHIYNTEAKFDENIIIKSEKLDSDHEETGLQKPYHSENFNKGTPSCKNSVESNSNVDWNMPELIPTICLDNDDSVPETEDKNCKVIDVADSPEMPTLVPFEAEESFQIKVECPDIEEKYGSKDADSHDSATDIRQPQIVLQRISVDRCPIPCFEPRRSSISEQLNVAETKKMSIEGPEIEEIEGVRFFQFRSKQEMEEFNRMPEAAEIDLDMIVPTKTTDITQIKGWRNKYFAPETQFQSFTNCNSIKTDDSSQDSSNLILTLNEQNKEEKAFKLNEEQKNSNEFRIQHSENDLKVTSEAKLNDDAVKAIPVSSKEENSDIKCLTDKNNEKFSLKKNDEKCSLKKMDEKYSPEKNPMSAFVSAELDSYLLNSSVLNVSLLQKVNPNIIPIPPDASILSLGKLRKTDRVIQPKKNHVFKDREDNLNSGDCVITLGDSPAPIITIGSSDEDSTDDDIPVAKLSGMKRIRSSDVKPVSNKCVKKKKIGDIESCRVSPRVVLRLKKENIGSSEGYKVSNISCKKLRVEQSRTTSSSSSSSSSESEEEMPESFKMSHDGSLPVIKKTLFLKDDEPHLLEEFLNNLNMYGTRKDVAMLVQSNQSYFDKGPALSANRTYKAVAALVSNELFAKLKFKQKVKKKVKSWEKYLPKISMSSKVQKTTMSRLKSKLKSSQVVDNALPPERGKRSIRLPARYLDSAVLAAGTEWVSPVLVPEGNVTKKSRKISSETVEEKSIPENTKDSVSCTEKSTSEEEESSSDEAVDTSDDLSDATVEHIKEECLKKFEQKSESSEMSNMKNRTFDKTKVNESVSNTDEDQNLLSDTVNPFPICSCLPCSRTVVYQKSKKDFICSCKITKDKMISLDESSKENNTSTLTSNSLQSVSELPDSKISVQEELPNLKPVSSSEETNKCSDAPGYINVASVKKSGDTLSNILSNSVTVQSKPYESVNQNASVSKSMIYVTNLGLTNSLGTIKQPFAVAPNDSLASLSTANSVSYVNNNMPSYPIHKIFNPLEENSSGALVSVPVSNMSDKLIFLVPVKATTNISKTGQSSHVPLLPKMPAETFEKAPVSSTNGPKGKLPILIRKVTSDKVPNASAVELGTGLNFLNCNPVNSGKMSFVPTLSHPNTSKNTPSSSPVTFKLPKTVENTESNFLIQNGLPKLPTSFSAVLNSTITTDKTPHILNSCNTSVTLPSPLQQVNPQGLQVKAYKVGDKYFICPSVMPAKELRPKSSTVNNSTIIATNAANQKTLPSVSPQVLPFNNINKENCKSQYQILQNGLAKQCIIGNQDSNESCLSSSCDQLKDAQTDASMPKTSSSESLSNCPLAATDCHNYYKTQKYCKRKLHPCNDVKENLDMDIDIETVDDSFDGLSELRKTSEILSESDISDNECESMYSSNLDPFAINLQVKSLKERKRRLQIRCAFEKLKHSSKSFKNANTCMEILAVACLVTKRATKQEKKLMCIKKWEQLRNAKLLKKLKQTINAFKSCESKERDIFLEERKTGSYLC